jgi:hypothetical protein
MDATMTLAREEITKTSLYKILIRFPWMTVKVIIAIYWQAIKLWWKGVPIFNHAEKKYQAKQIRPEKPNGLTHFKKCRDTKHVITDNVKIQMQKENKL